MMFRSRFVTGRIGTLGLLLATLLALAAGTAHAASAPLEGRSIANFDADWKFFKGDAPGAEVSTFDDSKWEAVNLPHDWSIKGSFRRNGPANLAGGYLPLGEGWYRKTFTLPADHVGKKVFIQFDGIHKNSDVWLNGHSLGNRWYGYVSFQYDLTPHLNPTGPNVLAVRVENNEQTSRWYTGSGIYRHVWLTVTDPLHVAHWGTAITTPEVSADQAVIHIQTEVENNASKEASFSLATCLLNPAGEEVATLTSTGSVTQNTTQTIQQTFKISAPVLWSDKTPALYTARTTLKNTDAKGEPGPVVDEVRTPFGIRSVEWRPRQGLFLNNQSVKLKGVCLHHDLGALGAAFENRAMERRLEVLKEVGCNAIRTSHNPPAPELLDMCDRMGFLVIDEAFDKWSGNLHPVFERDWKRDLRSMLLRDRNHPSIILWSVGNEVTEQKEKKGTEILKRLVDYVHQVEPSRKVTAAAYPAYSPDFINATDVAGLNYSEQWFEDYQKLFPEKILITTEGFVYYLQKDPDAKVFDPVNGWLTVLKHDFVAGMFIWTGIDYLGEAAGGWPSHGWNGSLIDTCGFRRPVSYLQESFWSEKPVVHLAVQSDKVLEQEIVRFQWGWPKMAAHWTLPAEIKGQEVKLFSFTNCDTVELFLNGRSLGVQKLADFPDKMMTWKAPYEPGVLKAVGRKGGQEVASHELKTAGQAKKIELRPDRTTLRADRHDLSHVEVRIVDAEGNLIPEAACPIQFEIAGPGRIAGVDNGDLWSLEPYKASKRTTYRGRALAIIQSASESAGTIHLKATAPNLESAEVTIENR